MRLFLLRKSTPIGQRGPVGEQKYRRETLNSEKGCSLGVPLGIEFRHHETAPHLPKRGRGLREPGHQLGTPGAPGGVAEQENGLVGVDHFLGILIAQLKNDPLGSAEELGLRRPARGASTVAAAALLLLLFVNRQELFEPLKIVVGVVN